MKDNPTDTDNPAEGFFSDPHPEIPTERIHELVCERADGAEIALSDLELCRSVEVRALNEPECEYLLSIIRTAGIYAPKSPEEGQKHLYNSAFRGYKPAQLVIGLDYAYGHNGEKDLFKAAKWLGKAAEGDNTDAFYHYGIVCLELFKQTGIEFFADEAFESLWEVAYDVCDANAILADMYLHGIGVPVSLETAEKMIEFLKDNDYDVDTLEKELRTIGSKQS